MMVETEDDKPNELVNSVMIGLNSAVSFISAGAYFIVKLT